MKISRISAYRVLLPLEEGSYRWSDSKAITRYDSTIVRVDTDAGITGWGEVCPLGPVYLPAYAEGARTGIAEIAPALIGCDPLQLDAVNAVMDATLKGHPYCKSPLDIACWDILGKHAGLPLCSLLGGRFGPDFAVYRSISQEPPETMADWVATHQKNGFRHFQLKVGGVADEDIARIRAVAALMQLGGRLICDANTGWLTADALRLCRAVRDLDVHIEQPCLSYEECLTVRRHTDLPFILDESIQDVASLLRAHADGAMDVVNLKIGKVGGLTRARQIRDLCVSLGIGLTIEDMPGADITGATILHLAHSTPEKYRFSVTSSYLKVTETIAAGGPVVVDGRTRANDGPGLGVEPIMGMLGEPIFAIG
ncbi:MAG: cis-3-hydroxy-L-proline dehydratase [Alphaproteobacteria bacterium]